jgi:hypothetical protein
LIDEVKTLEYAAGNRRESMTGLLLTLAVALGIIALFIVSLLLRSRVDGGAAEVRPCANCGCGRGHSEIERSRKILGRCGKTGERTEA